VVRLPSFPNSASAEMSVSLSLLLLRMESNGIQPKIKAGEVTQFPQYCKYRDIHELLIGRAWGELE
jgi:hypothetical protein